MPVIYNHYVIGIDFGSEQYIVHRRHAPEDPGQFEYSFEKKEIVNGTAAKQTIGFLLADNALELIKELQDPLKTKYLSTELRENLELLEVIQSLVPISDTRMRDYPR